MSKISRFWVAASAVTAMAFCAQASAVIGAVVNRSARQLNAEFPEVVMLRSKSEVCTGTIIGPRVILSAAHCTDLESPYAEHKGRRYAVTFAHSSEYPTREHDVAVAMTDRDIEGASFAEIGRGLRHGSQLLLAGFGCTKRGGPSGILHLGQTRVIGMDEDHVLSFQPHGGVLCQGDSGGPAFVKENGRHVVVAVNSAGDIRDVNLNVRLDSAASRGFLRAVASKFKVAICGVTKSCSRRT